MDFFNGFSATPELRTACALGNFDGVHLGHGKIIATLKDKARQYGVKSCVITFDPHPQKFLRSKTAHLLVPFEERLKLLEKSGIEIAVRLEFCKSLSLMSPESFIREIMVEKAGVKSMVVGPRFGFGRNRSGNVDMLKKLGVKYGFETVVLEPARVGYERVSSSRIRELVLEGRVAEASEFLGYRYHIRGVVEEGEKRGREIGFPTLNLKTQWEILPKPGVYATFTEVSGEGRCGSITNIGIRPTFGGDKTVIESHLIDIKGDFYGRETNIEFVERVRDEKKFASAAELSEQIGKDIGRVRSIIEKNGAEQQP